MTTIMGHFRLRAAKECSASVERIKAGYLQVYSSSSQKDPQQKWVTLEKQDSSSKYQLNIYSNNKEKKLKRKSHSLDRESFIGIEEGNVGKESNRYFSIFFAKNIVIFQTKDREEANDWCDKFKEHFTCERWTVRLMDTDESISKMTSYLLHVTASAVSLTTFNPSQLYKRWSIKHINCVSCDNGFLSIGVTGAGIDSGYYQIKPHNSTQMAQMKDAIDNKRKNLKNDKTQDSDEDNVDNPEHGPGQQVNMRRMSTELPVPVPKSAGSTTAPVTSQNSAFPDVVDKKDAVSKPVISLTVPVMNQFPDVVPDTNSKPIENSDVNNDETSQSRDEITARPEGVLNGVHDYINVKASKPPTEPIQKPPPRPPKDHRRHFKSETVGETIAAIRAKKQCFRDSLNISPSKRDNVFAKMDATGWWKDLAAAIGLNVGDIQTIENLAPVLSKSWTETVIYHWECTRNPLRICNIREIQNIARETNRHDLLSMLAEE